MVSKQVVIVGAGPAGMMLAYQLASNGIGVRVLERHPDFEREFRGELFQASVVEQLTKSGLMKLLLDRGHALLGMARHMFVGPRRRVRVPGQTETGAVITQPGFLGLLHELCGRFPGYQLDFGTTVLEAVPRDGRVVAMKVRRAGAEERVESELFIVCNGRNSALRKSCGLATEEFETTADALWLRFDFSSAPQLLPETVNVHMFGAGVVTVLQPSAHQRLHVAYSAPGDLATLKKNLPELERRLLPTIVPTVRDAVQQQLNAETQMQVLKILVDRVTRWHAPGILFLGDAAHTMSPSGGQGLNVAIRDTFVAANHLVPLLREGKPVDETVLQAIQAERMPEVDAIQKGQTRAGQMVLKPRLVLHFMFTILAVVMLFLGKKLQRGNGIAPPQPLFLTPL